MNISVYLDDENQPIAVLRPPERFVLDTQEMEDGPHVLRLVAAPSQGNKGLSEIPFTVRNGPGIAVIGLAEDQTVSGSLDLLVNGFQMQPGDVFEPTRAETPAPIPTWAWVLCLLIGTWAMGYIVTEYRDDAEAAAAAAPSAALRASSAAPGSSPIASERALGAQLYGNYCSACHQSTGTGLSGVFPSLVDDPVVNAEDPTEHIRIVLNGLSGKEINGVSYAAAMPPFSGQLTDEEIAAVVTYERQEWGSSDEAVTAEQVAEQRKKGQ